MSNSGKETVKPPSFSGINSAVVRMSAMALWFLRRGVRDSGGRHIYYRVRYSLPGD